MDFSRKIILASCICSAFLAGIAGCMAEDRDLEEKGLFRCMSDDDCLSGSFCVKPDGKETSEGTCYLEKDINHCHDYDGDGFYAADRKSPTGEAVDYSSSCGFSEKNPEDRDDSDAEVYPGAAEKCDGKDNSQDGCIDGSCDDGEDCTSDDKSHCRRLYRACVGNVTYSEILNYSSTVKSVCDPALIGGNFCIDGSWTFAKFNRDGNFTDQSDVTVVEGGINFTSPTGNALTLTSCPSEAEVGFVDVEEGDTSDAAVLNRYDNGFDEDCDGNDAKGVSCESMLTDERRCVAFSFVYGSSSMYYVESYNEEPDSYESIKAKCDANGDTACLCIGEYKCIDGARQPVCMNGDTQLTKESVKEASAADPTAWKCLTYGDK